jgi:carbamoyl-phosphate synthase large subunit
MKRLTMLLSSAGRRVELLEAFRQSAGELGIELTVLATDMAPEWSAACQRADASFAVPRAGDAAFIPAMLELCRTNRVDLVIPTIDTGLHELSAAAADFAAIGTRVAVSEPAFVAVARDKLATAQTLAAAGVPTVPTAELDAVRADPAAWPWPLLLKPRHGSAGRAISVVASPEELPAHEAEPLIAQQLLRGDEYTINMFFDRSGKAHCVIPHRRVQVRAGEVEKGVTERHDELCRIGWQIADALEGIRGVICFQVILDPAGPAVFEINARFGGGYPLAHAAGATFARWLLEEAAGLPLSAHDAWREGVTMLRYDSAVFLQP